MGRLGSRNTLAVVLRRGLKFEGFGLVQRSPKNHSWIDCLCIVGGDNIRVQTLGLILLALLLVPGVSAQTPLQDSLFGEGNEGGTVRYQIRDITNTTTGGFNSSFAFLKLHTNELGPGGVILRINVQATFTLVLENDGSWLYELLVDGLSVEDCLFEVPTRDPGGFLAGDLPVYPSYDVECTLPPTITGNWTEGETIAVEWRRTVLGGTPDPPEASVVSIIIDREDLVILSSPTAFEAYTGATGIEVLMILAAFMVGVIVWARVGDTLVRVVGALWVMLVGVMVLGALMPEWSVWGVISAIMLLIGAFMTYRAFNETGVHE